MKTFPRKLELSCAIERADGGTCVQSDYYRAPTMMGPYKQL